MPTKGGRKQAHGGGSAGQDNAGSPGAKINVLEKINEIVDKVVPEHLLRVILAGAAVLTVLLLILMIVAFARDPDEAAKGQIVELEQEIEAADEALKEEKRAHSETRDEMKKAARGTAGFEGDLKQAKDKLARLEETAKAADAKVDELRGEMKKVVASRKEMERQLKTANDDAKRAKKEMADARGEAQKAADSLAALTKEYEELEQQRDEAKKVHDRAQSAFDSIVKNVSGIENPEKRIEAIERLRTASQEDLQGTDYMDKLEKMIDLAQKRAKGEAKDAYGEYMDRLDMATDYDAQMAILVEAKKKFDEQQDTAHALRIHNQIEARRTDHEDEAARQVHAEAMAAVLKESKAHEANIALLKEAVEKTRGTRWSEVIEMEITKRERTLPDDIARALYEELVSKSRLEPDDHAGNLAFAEEIKSKISPRYEKKYAKVVASLNTAQLKAKGRQALTEAQQLIAENPDDHAGNIGKLGDLVAMAEGSPFESKLVAMLQKERKLLALSEK